MIKYLAYSEDFVKEIFSFAEELIKNKIPIVFVFGDKDVHKEIMKWQDGYSETLNKEGELYHVITSHFLPKEKCEFYFFIDEQTKLKEKDLFYFSKINKDSNYFSVLIKNNSVKNKVLHDKKNISTRQISDIVILHSPFSYIQKMKVEKYSEKKIDFFICTGMNEDIYFCEIPEKKGVYIRSGKEIYFYSEDNIIFA